ncbi:hypothetical protein FACS1894184_16030 [Clostridia bacterium]|nr:hypothetical protein FACS1894184_16030 [Clostridia bacterium]
MLPCDAEKTVAEIDAIFTQIYDDAANAPQPPSFTELVVKHMKRLGCETDTQFAEMTLLDASFYWQIIRHDKRVWSRNTAWSIIAGFKLNRIQMCELLASLNIVLHPESSYEDRVYSFMFGKLEGRPIDEWNRFLKKRGLLFDFPKFRSMIVDADRVKNNILSMNEKDGPIFKIMNDPRITKVGHFIRKYSIDELPQLICVLAGKMSLVGPRPPLPEEVQKYTEYELQRLVVTPGLSCVWQISGRSELSFEQWIELDLDYIKKQNTINDLRILIKTPMAILRPRGAY